MSYKTFLFSFFLFSSISINAQIWNSPEAITPINVGDPIPDGNLVDQDLNSTSLYTILNDQAAVVVIYRGGWCPYCNKQLAELTTIEQQIKELGYRIIAISPEDATNIKSAIENNAIEYEIYSDKGAKLIQKLGLAFYSSDRTNNYIEKKSEGENSGILPVPAVMIISKDKKVNYIYYDADYKVRLEAKELISVLKSMK